MAESNSCPSTNELHDFAVGIVGEDEAEAIVEHLDRCAGCDETVDNLELGDDTLISAIQRPRLHDPYADEPGCRRVEAMAQEIGRDPAARLALAPPHRSRPRVADRLPLGRFAGYELLEVIARGGMG